MTVEYEVETEEERAETARDLRREADEMLGKADRQKEWTVEDVSPSRKLYVLYSMQTGERIAVPRFVFDVAINRLIPGTNKHAFTARKSLAPKQVVGKLMCFFHPDSPEADSLEELGIVPICNANELRSEYSRRMHAQNKHPTLWAMWSEHVQAKEREEEREERHVQTDAMLKLAGARSQSEEDVAAAPVRRRSRSG